MITALMAQVDSRFPEDNYSVSVNSHIPLIDTKAARSINPLERIHAITTRNWQASNEPCVIIQICPSGLLFTKTRLQLTCWHFTAKEEDTGLEKSKCWNRVDRLSRWTGSERKHQKHIQKKKNTYKKNTYNHDDMKYHGWVTTKIMSQPAAQHL